jgi:hypothetical protein
MSEKLALAQEWRLPMAVPPRPEIARPILRVLPGWLAACLSALPLGLIAIAVIAGPPRDVSDLVFLLQFGLALTLAISAPSLVIAIVVERMGARRAGWYVCAGAGVAGVAACVTLWLMPTDHVRKFSMETISFERRLAMAMTLLAIAAPIGALAGYVYWQIAVRARERL